MRAGVREALLFGGFALLVAAAVVTVVLPELADEPAEATDSAPDVAER
jgi:hypothetical protein